MQKQGVGKAFFTGLLLFIVGFAFPALSCRADLTVPAEQAQDIFEEAPPAEPAGWREDKGGKWYAYEDGSYPRNTWEKIDGSWYYFGKWGYPKTGWFRENGLWYYLNSDGVMQTGWLLDNGYCYYLNRWGAMRTGWQSIDGNWYYFGKWGDRKSGWTKQGEKWYYLDKDGVMCTGWRKIGKDWYYFSTEGAMQSDTITDGYYLQSSGVMLAGKVADVREKKKKWLLVGDSRTMQLANQYLGYPYVMNGKYPAYIGADTLNGYIISQGSMGLAWLKQQDITSKVDSDTAVIICMGTNDAAGGKTAGEQYADWLNQKAKDWTGRGAAVWFVSTGPVYDPKARLTNASILAFNASVKKHISDKVYYFDLYPCIYSEVANNSSATDGMGVHYKKPLYAKIYRLIKSICVEELP